MLVGTSVVNPSDVDANFTSIEVMELAAMFGYSFSYVSYLRFSSVKFCIISINVNFVFAISFPNIAFFRYPIRCLYFALTKNFYRKLRICGLSKYSPPPICFVFYKSENEVLLHVKDLLELIAWIRLQTLLTGVNYASLPTMLLSTVQNLQVVFVVRHPPTWRFVFCLPTSFRLSWNVYMAIILRHVF